MQIEILLFGPQAKLAQTDRVAVQIDEDAPTVGSAMRALHDALPALRPTLEVSRLAVNHAYATDEDMLNASDEVALIGMVSGG